MAKYEIDIDLIKEKDRQIEQLKKEKEWLLNKVARQTLEIDMGHLHYEGKKQHTEKCKIEIAEEMQQALKRGVDEKEETTC